MFAKSRDIAFLNLYRHIICRLRVGPHNTVYNKKDRGYKSIIHPLS